MGWGVNVVWNWCKLYTETYNPLYNYQFVFLSACAYEVKENVCHLFF
jgi:hypothetical protein